LGQIVPNEEDRDFRQNEHDLHNARCWQVKDMGSYTNGAKLRCFACRRHALDCGGLTPLLINNESAVKPAHSKALRAREKQKNMLNLAPFGSYTRCGLDCVWNNGRLEYWNVGNDGVASTTVVQVLVFLRRFLPRMTRISLIFNEFYVSYPRPSRETRDKSAPATRRAWFICGFLRRRIRLWRKLLSRFG
jgi:hypothetical protein